jgi:uncharacterized protein (TIGR02466 family)
MDTLMHPNQHNIFFVPIWGYIIKGEQYHSSDYLDLIENLQATEPSARKSNFGGWQSRDNLHKEGVFQELNKSLLLLANDIAKSQALPPVHLISMWANINYKNSFNAPHTHEGIFSGVFYLTAPENSGKLIFKNPVVRSETSPYKLADYPIQPAPLACIIFPSWLEHYVEPSLSDEKRVSLSFNFDIERPIS